MAVDSDSRARRALGVGGVSALVCALTLGDGGRVIDIAQ